MASMAAQQMAGGEGGGGLSDEGKNVGTSDCGRLDKVSGDDAGEGRAKAKTGGRSWDEDLIRTWTWENPPPRARVLRLGGPDRRYARNSD